ncbi:MAG: DUF4276 family protein [Deltaproteobacteria bacterium]|nr:DUF4276 family protein [Deltaproteobacteria bacterium]
MHIELLVEDASGAALLAQLLPRILGGSGVPHTWRVHPYKGVGKIPEGLRGADANKRILLDQLPRILAGYAKTPGIDAVVVVVDTDRQSCHDFLAELTALARQTAPALNVIFRLAIEEVEAWYFGDTAAVALAYPRAKHRVLATYVQDSVCGTWELLADALYPGGSARVKQQGWPAAGALKHEWAQTIGPHMDLWNNNSPRFNKFRAGLERLVAGDASDRARCLLP